MGRKMNYRRPYFLLQGNHPDPIGWAARLGRPFDHDARVAKETTAQRREANARAKPHKRKPYPRKASPLDNVTWGPWKAVKPVSNAPGAFQNERSGTVDAAPPPCLPDHIHA